MKVKRSSKLTIKFATAKKRALLKKIITEYSLVVMFFIDFLWDKNLTKTDLLKNIINLPKTWLSARMCQCAAREALDMVNNAKKAAKAQKRKATKPRHYGKKMSLTSQIISIQKGCNSFDLWLVFTSIGNKIKIYIPLKKHRQFNWYQDWKMAKSIIVHEDYIQISFEKEFGNKKTSGIKLGIDVGINHLIALSDKRLYGSNVKEYINIIKRKTQNSKAYKRAKKTLSYYNHRIIKEFFRDNNLRLVVVENLKGLKSGKHNRGKEFRKTLSNWNYRELLNMIQMRTEENRVSFRSVSPYKTSQQCPYCSHAERGNRLGENFYCLKCGYSGHADIVGAINILDRFISGRYGAAFQT